jgi:hypothetical protein
MSRESKNPPHVWRWVDVGLWNEPYGRHLYGVDHHQFRAADTVSLLIEEKLYSETAHPSTPTPSSWE